ncbi:fibronectin type III domain-containing protein [Neobacillus cucumis]|uniref:fibronectin type III domain-containing protein n=1 Tax=Neobacillus cucumis TaxID=1740721 RepID=UPI002E200131|nr:fibronectin type III domain-containing protein [Neobacillus cucumis]
MKAINGTLSSQYSNTSSVTITAVAPAAPTNLTASVQSGPSVRLSWTDQSLNETGFTIERSIDGVNFAVIGTRGVNSGSGTTVTYSDTTVQAGKKYYYRVNAVNGNTPSSYSNTVNVTISNVPAAPTGVSATATSGTTTDTIRVSWTAPAGTINSYDVQFSTDSSFATNVSTYNTGSNWTTYSRTGFLKKKTYYVRVRAVNQIGNSTWSNSISILTP